MLGVGMPHFTEDLNALCGVCNVSGTYSYSEVSGAMKVAYLDPVAFPPAAALLCRL